jgi:hypothetical protein
MLVQSSKLSQHTCKQRLSHERRLGVAASRLSLQSPTRYKTASLLNRLQLPLQEVHVAIMAHTFVWKNLCLPSLSTFLPPV